ncbi:MAG: hypothetical protein ACRBB6_15005 [Neptuniibacter sp.]
MSLTAAIQKYSTLRTAFEQDEADYLNTVNVRLPQEKSNLSSLETQVKNAKAALKQAETTIDVKARRDDLKAKEEAVKDQAQLIDNLGLRVKKWEIDRSGRRSGLEQAEHDMWTLKKAELLGQLSISPAIQAVLEDIIAANDVMEKGFGYRLFGDAINEVLPEMEYDNVKQHQENLRTEMGV